MVAIELLIVVGIILVLLLWACWYRFSTWRLKRKYEKLKAKGEIIEKDGRIYDGKIKYPRESGEERRAEIARRKSEILGGDSETPDTDWSVPRPPQPAAGRLFSPAASSADRKTDSNGRKAGTRNGEARRTPGNPFIRRAGRR